MAFITECGGRHGVRLVMTLILRTMQAISELSDCILPAKEDLRDSEEHIQGLENLVSSFDLYAGIFSPINCGISVIYLSLVK